MKFYTLIILIIGLSNTSYSQIHNKTKSFLEVQANSKQKYEILKKVKINKINADFLPLENYIVFNIYSNVDLNFDKINDVIVLLDEDYRKVKPYNAQEPYLQKVRVLLMFYSNNIGEFELVKIISNPLNQYTEGLHGNLKIIVKDAELIFRENGTQIDTDWVTDLIFNKDFAKKEWVLKEAKSYSAKINQEGIEIKKPIEIINVKERVLLDSVNYYNYFPFGFTDNIPANKN